MSKQTKTVLTVESLELRSLPSHVLAPPFQDESGIVVFIPPGVAGGEPASPAAVIKEGDFHPPAFGPGTPGSEHATVWLKTDGQEGRFVPGNYHDVRGGLPVAFFGE